MVGHVTRGSPPIFAIVCCVRSTQKQHDLVSTTLFRTFLPSMDRTITVRERLRWRVNIYLCADADDLLYVNRTALIESAAPRGMRIRLLSVVKERNDRVPSREAAAMAFADGAEYLHRTNDDIRYLSEGWITGSVRALLSLDPPNIGVVGPKVYGDGSQNKLHGGMTIDVVHRTHLHIFKEYYPPQLDNWYTDTWILYVYVHALGDRKRIVKLGRADNFTAMHSFERRRYRPSTTQLKLLPALTECGRDAIASYINRSREHNRGIVSGGGVMTSTAVSCRAYESLPAGGSSSGGRCTARRNRVGGIEMSTREFQSNVRKVAGWCDGLPRARVV